MGKNAMREQIRRSNKAKNRPSGENCLGCQSCGNRCARRPGSPTRPANPSHRTATIPRTAGERATSQNRSRVSAGAQTLSLALQRPKRIQPQSQINRTLISTSRPRRQRTRPRSRANNQSGGPVGGDLAVPGDQPTSPQTPEELREQTDNTAELIRLDICRPLTPPPRTSSTTAHGSTSETCQRALPARWSFLRKYVQKVRESQTDLKRCSPVNTGPPDVPTSTEITAEGPEDAGMTSSSEAPVTSADEVVPRMRTGFYFGTSYRQSWPYTGASAEYFTAVSNRRIKKLEPSLNGDEITTTFEADEEDPMEKRRPATGEANDQGMDASTNAEAAAAAATVCSGRGKRSSRHPHSVRKARRGSSATTSRAYRKGRLRRAQRSNASSTHIRGSVMHEVLRKILAVGQRRNKKRPKKNADSKRSNSSNDRIRPTATRTTPIIRSQSPERETFSPKSCLTSPGPSRQNKNQRHRHNRQSVREEEKHSVSRQNSRECTHNKHTRGSPSYHRQRASQQRKAQKVRQRTSPDAPKRSSRSQPLSGNCQKMYSTVTPHRVFRGINKCLTAITRGSTSFQDPEYSTVETSCCTETDISGTTPTLSGCRHELDVTEEACRIDGTSKLSPHCIRAGRTNPNKVVAANTLEKQEVLRELGAQGFEHRGQKQTVRQGCNIFPNFISSKLGSNGTLNAQLFINNVLRKPTESIESLPYNGETLTPDKRTKIILASNDRISRDTTTNTCVRPGVNKNCIRGVSLNNDHSDFLMRCLVKSSVGVQNVVFPHLNTAERVSKTTQITPDDLVSIQGNTVGDIPVSSRTLNTRDTVYLTQKCMELPLQGNAIPSTSRRKARKIVRQKKKMNVLTKNRRPPKYKFVKRTTRTSTSKMLSTCRRTISPPDNANNKKRHEVGKEQSTEILEATSKSVQKKFLAQGTRDIDDPLSTACMSRFKQKPFRILRIHNNMENNSRSDLVSLFRAETRGSSVQSVEVDSSNSMFGVKPSIFMEHGKRPRAATLPPKSRTHAKSPGKVNHAGPESQSKRDNVGSFGVAKRNERTKQTTSKPPVNKRTRIHVFTAADDRVPRAPAPGQPHDPVSNVLSNEQQRSSASKIPNDFRLKTSSPKLPRDSPTDSLPQRLSPTLISYTTFGQPRNSTSRPLHWELDEKIGSKTYRSSDTGSKRLSPKLSNGLSNVLTPRIQSFTTSTRTSKKSSSLIQKIQQSTLPIDSNTITVSPKSSTDSRQRSRTPKSWTDSRQNEGILKSSSDLRQNSGTPKTSSDSRHKPHALTPSKQHSFTSRRHTPISKVHTPTSKAHSPATPESRRPTSPKPQSPTSPETQSRTSPKPYTPTSRSYTPSSKPYTPTSPNTRTPRDYTPDISGPHTPTSSRHAKKIAHHPKLRTYFESRTHTPRPRDAKPVNLKIELELKSSAHKASPPSNNGAAPPKPRKIVKKRRAPSPPLGFKPQAHQSSSKNKDIETLDTDPKIHAQLVFSQSIAENSHGNCSSNHLTLPDLQTEEVSRFWMLQSNQNDFHLHLNEKAKYCERLPLHEITSYCSCEINEGRSFSSTSMIPAVGSYEDKFLSPRIWCKSDDYNHKTHSAGNFLTSKAMFDSPFIPETLQSLAEPPSDIQHKTQKSTEEYSENRNNITTCCEAKSSKLSQHSAFYQYDDSNRLVGSKGNAGLKDPDNNNIPTSRIAGVRCKSESRSDLTDRKTEPNQLEQCCVLVKDQEQRHDSGHMTEELFATGKQESVSMTGILIPLQNKSCDSTGCSAESMVASVLGRLSSQEATESCQIYTQSEIASKQKRALHDISSLTDVVSCISSIPEDTLPNVANSDSTACQMLLEELSCDYPEQETKELIDSDNYTYNDKFCPPASHAKSLMDYHLGMTELKQNPYDTETTQLKEAPETESYKRSHGRSSAAMHVSWDISTSKNFYVHAKCSRCGTLRTEGTEMCQSVATCWHEPQIQDDQYYASGNRYPHCGRCVTCLREKCFTKERWSKSSPTIPSSPCTHHKLYHEKHLDQTSLNSDQTATKVHQNNFDISCGMATRETQQDDLLDTKTGLFRTPIHLFPSSNFSQASPSHNSHIPLSTESRNVLQPDPKSPTLMTPGYNSSRISRERVDDNNCWSCSHYVEPARVAVASFWPTLPTPELRSTVNTPTFDMTKQFKTKLSCRHHPHLTLSAVYTTCLPQDVVTEGTSRSYNKDIVLQRVADLLETRSSVLSIDSYNKVLLKAEDGSVGTDESKPISKFSQKSKAGNQRLSTATSTSEPPDAHLERVVAEIADRVNDFLRDMAQAVGELHHIN